MSTLLKNVNRLPSHMRDSALLWIQRGLPHPDDLGGFLRGVLMNDLMHAAATADHINREALPDWAAFLYEAPPPAFGSKENLLAWHEAGGEVGLSAHASGTPEGEKTR